MRHDHGLLLAIHPARHPDQFAEHDAVDVQGLALFDRLGHEGVDCARLGRIVLSQVTREDVSGSASWVSFRT